MLELLWLIPALPFAGFAVLVFLGPRMSKGAAATVGVGSVGLSAAVFFAVAAGFLGSDAREHGYVQTLWSWMRVGELNPGISFRLDALSLVFVFVITFVGFLIHLYSAQYMEDEEGYARFFSYMNLFVGSMLTLVLADNMLLLFLGWEGVGLCSYLLIGFWYRDVANVRAARKAFVVTRVGDTAFLIGLFLIFTNLGTLNIQEAMARAEQQWPIGSALAVWAALLLLGGAVGKSAQLPLQTWLPDAMAGPTPVSALIHAATMVTAGVYLIARTNVLYTLAPTIQLLVGVVGALTLLIAGFSALTQFDIKRVLAYSTISQIGYMFLALGVGAWSAGVFHFMTHAFFKALLFLTAGVVILAMHHEQNMFHMGGLRKRMPFAYWCFLIGGASLAALPLVTAGFYSKDAILEGAWAMGGAGYALWAAGLLGAFLTGLYTFRAIFIVFFGEVKHEPVWSPDMRIKLPLAILAVLSVIGGLVEVPKTILGMPFAGVTLLPDLLHPVLPEAEHHVSLGTEAALQWGSAAIALFGVWVAYMYFVRSPQRAAALAKGEFGEPLGRLFLSGMGFDWVYDRLFVWPLSWLARIGAVDIVNLFWDGVGRLNGLFNRALSWTQSGVVRWYAAGIALGAIIVIAIGAFGR